MGERYAPSCTSLDAVPEAPSITKMTCIQKDLIRESLELTWKLLEHVRGPAPIGSTEERPVKCLLDDLHEQIEMLNAVKSNLNELATFLL